MGLPVWITDIYPFEDKQYSIEEWAKIIMESGINPEAQIRVEPNIPCPKRSLLMGQPQFMMTWPKFARNVLFNSGQPGELTPSDFVDFAYKSVPEELLKVFWGDNRGIHAISAREQAVKVLHIIEGNRLFTIRNDTAEKLGKTTINQDVPIQMLHIPQSGIVYVEVGDKKPAVPELQLANADDPYESDYLEGFYMYENLHEGEGLERHISAQGESVRFVMENVFGYTGWESVRSINFHFQGIVDNTNPNPANTSFAYLSIYIPVYEDRDISLSELLEKHLEWWHSDETVIQHLGADPELIKRDEEFKRKLLSFAAIVCLYIGSSSYREEFYELTEARKRIQASGTKKKPKAIRKSLRTVDRIYVSPVLKDSERLGGSSGEKGKKSFHIRNGHMRLQAYGEGRKLRKIKWIEPMLINAESEEMPVQKQRKY